MDKIGIPGDQITDGVNAHMMHWVYWAKLYESKFQAGCLAKRMEEDWWIYGYECPQEIEVYKSRKGRFGVRYSL